MKEFLEYILKKYKYGSHSMSLVYDFESKAADAYDENVSEILRAIETGGIDYAFSVLNGLNVSSDVKALIFIIICKSDSFIGFFPQKTGDDWKDISTQLDDQYLRFLNENKEALAAVLVRYCQVLSIEAGIKLIAGHVKWLVSNEVDDDVISELYASHSMTTLLASSVISDVEKLNPSQFLRRMATTTKGEFLGFVAAYLINCIFESGVQVMTAAIHSGWHLDYSMYIPAQNRKEYSEKGIYSSQKGLVFSNEYFISFEQLYAFLMKFNATSKESKILSFFEENRTLDIVKMFKSKFNCTECIVSANEINVASDVLNIHWVRPPYATENREITKEIITGHLLSILEKIEE